MRHFIFTAVRCCMVVIILSAASNAFAVIKLPALVSNNMIIQRDVKVNIWGWADAGEAIKVQFKGKIYHTQTGENGKWLVKLNPSAAGGPFDMDISGKSDRLHITGILVGDVWLCSGQSNMELDFYNSNVRKLYEKDIANSTNDQIRQIQVIKGVTSSPAEDFKTTGWKSADPKNVMSFTAVGYFFARNIYEKYHVPVGIINSSFGGTIVEAWTSEEGLKEFPKFDKEIAFVKDSAALYGKIRAVKKAIIDWNTAIATTDKGLDANGKPLWTADFDDSAWPVINEPAFWDTQGMPRTFGSVWLRKEITLPENIAGQEALLQLGRIDDADVTYFNGQEIGHDQYRDNKRKYKVPASLVKAGKNIIAIRIMNFNGTGGMFAKDTMAFKSGNTFISLSGDWKYQTGVKMGIKPNVYNPQDMATSLYNGMIAPLLQYNIKGVAWYQGEFNTRRAYEYRKLFQGMINNWRINFARGDFPFVYVQLPNYQPVIDHPAESEWAELREAQSMALVLPNTAMAVTIDAGGLDLHPSDKKDVGDRLALAARKLAYREKELVASGPVYKSMAVVGNKIVLTFDNGKSKMISKDGQPLKYFAIAGNDKKFIWGDAVIKGNTVEVSSPQINDPVAVRYAWAGNPDGCNLYNEAGLPASPFRTDDWPGMTVNNK